MWHLHGPNCTTCDLGLRSVYGLGHWNYGITPPTGWTTPTLTGHFPYGTYPSFYSPFTVPTSFFKTNFTPYLTMNTNLTPALWNLPFGFDKLGWGIPYGLDRLTWGQPFGFERFGTMKFDTRGHTPWFVNGQFGTVPFTTPVTTPTFPFVGPMGLFGTPYTLNTALPFGFTGYRPFGLTGLDDRFRFGTPFPTSLFGFQTVPFDWKLKNLATPLGMTTDAWTNTFRTNLPWTTGRIPGPLAVL